MAQEIREFSVTVPAGTPISAPLVIPIVFPVRVVTAISWRVPPGPNGLMGWQLTSAGAPVIPIQPNTYIVTDNQADTWELEGYLDSGNWAVTAYNLGVYPHVVRFIFLLDLPGQVTVPAGPATGGGAAVSGLGGSVDLGGTGALLGPSPAPTPGGDGPSVIVAVLAALAAQLP